MRLFQATWMSALTLLALAVPAAVADPFSAGNLAVLRVGNGTDTLGSAAAAVSILEFSRSGTLVQTINVTSTGSGAATVQGSTTTMGVLSLSGNGQFLTFGGIRLDAGTANANASTADRVAGRVNLITGTVDTSTAITDAYSGLTIRSLATNDGNQYWTSGENGTEGGLRYVATHGSATTSTVVGSTANNLRQVQVINGNLFVSSGSATPGRSVFKVGDGLPTGGTPTFTTSVPTANPEQLNSFYFTNLGGQNWNSTGFDTIYAIATNNSTLNKYTFDGTNWVLETGSVNLTGISNVTAVTNGSTVTLWATTPTSLVTLTDTSGYDGNINGAFSTLASAGTNFAFRGVSVVPEPTSLALCGLAGVGFAGAAFRRYRAKRRLAV